eukprot:scaffold130179_cov54-Phaeocystis_antarctica.AAC.1
MWAALFCRGERGDHIASRVHQRGTNAERPLLGHLQRCHRCLLQVANCEHTLRRGPAIRARSHPQRHRLRGNRRSQQLTVARRHTLRYEILLRLGQRLSAAWA